MMQISPKKYAGRYTVTLIPGDGIGPDISESLKKVFEALNVPVDFEQYNLSGVTHEEGDNDELLQEALASLRRNKIGIKGPLYTQTSLTEPESMGVTMRKDLDMYASLSLCKNIPGVDTRMKNVDFAIIRENTEGEYSGLEHQVGRK